MCMKKWFMFNHCTFIAGDDSHKQPCLFSDPVELILYMYIMMLFHAIDTKLIKNIVYTKWFMINFSELPVSLLCSLI